MAAPASASASAAAAGGGEASIDPPAPGMLAMPPRTLAAQRVIDSIYAVPGPATAAEVEGLAFAVALRKFRVQSTTQLSPIQNVWQQGEFIRLALEAGQPEMAIRVATVFVRALTNTGTEAALFARPESALYLDVDGDNPMSVVAMQGADALLFLAYYAPLCPDLGDSLALLKQVVHTVGPQISPLWISTILQADDYQFYMFKFTPNFSNWFHVMRRDHTLAAAKWLLGPEQPLLVQIASIGNVRTVRALEHAPPAIRDLILNAILHTQTREVIIGARALISNSWFIADARHFAIRSIDRHLVMHAPPTGDHELISDAQAQIMSDLVDQMTRASGGDMPHELAGLVMDYVRRDETVAGGANASALTPYQQREAFLLRRQVGRTQIAMADERVAASGPRPAPAVSHPRPGNGDGGEDESKQRARLGARFLSHTLAPTVHW